jgi:uncharacterized membrane protein YeaQ/YmgE (transglycosylase-associated protein family)
MNGILISILIGAIAGWLAQYITTEEAPFGIIGDIILGMVGGVIGGWLFDFLGLSASGLVGQLVVSVIGAVFLIYAIRIF